MIVYKITNEINGKVYIGLTTCTLEYRWVRHLTEGRNKKNNLPLYRAIRKHGEDNFSIEIICETNDKKELSKLERHYIRLYDSTNPDKGYNMTKGGENQYDGNPMAKVTEETVREIRRYYQECKLSVKECWKLYYSDVLSFSGFQKIWDGTTWHGIMQEVYTKENIDFHKSQCGLKGEKNINSMYTDCEVFEIRKYYANHTLEDTYKKYGYKSSSKVSFRHVADGGGFKHIPYYKKWKKAWFIYGKEIDITTYKPVSTISGTGE